MLVPSVKSHAANVIKNVNVAVVDIVATFFDRAKYKLAYPANPSDLSCAYDLQPLDVSFLVSSIARFSASFFVIQFFSLTLLNRYSECDVVEP